jgi:hypothetical protein
VAVMVVVVVVVVMAGAAATAPSGGGRGRRTNQTIAPKNRESASLSCDIRLPISRRTDQGRERPRRFIRVASATETNNNDNDNNKIKKQ